MICSIRSHGISLQEHALALHTKAFNKTGVLDLVSLKVDYIESWDTGSCVSNEHGANDCVSDRYQLCAQNKLSSKEAWMFIW